MSYDAFSMIPSASARRRGQRAVVITARTLLLAGALLAATGCNGCSGTSPKVFAVPSTKINIVASTNPSATDYGSSAKSGEAAVSGTSTLHDWTVKSPTLKGEAEFVGKWNDTATQIELKAIEFVVPVNTLKSTEGSGMDDTMYGALNLKKYPEITYKMTTAKLKSPPANPGEPYQFETTGKLTVSGQTRDENLDLAVLPHEEGNLTISTDTKLKMTDFKMSPPTAMFGVIKSGDAIAIKVVWQLQKLPAPTTRSEK